FGTHVAAPADTLMSNSMVGGLTPATARGGGAPTATATTAMSSATGPVTVAFIASSFLDCGGGGGRGSARNDAGGEDALQIALRSCALASITMSTARVAVPGAGRFPSRRVPG